MTVQIAAGSNVINVTMNQSTVVTYRLTVTIQGSGTTNPAAGAYDIPSGQTVNLSATPAAGWTFRTWSWPGNDPDYSGWPDNPISWAMAENIAVIAVFDQEAPPNTYPLTISVSGSGTTDPTSGNFPAGSLQITATPTYGWHFVNWSNGSTANPLTVVIPDVSSITAIFEQDAQDGLKPICVFYYGGWSSSVRDRLIAQRPKYVVSDWGVWPSIPNSDVTALTGAGIIFCAYIPPGGMRGYKYGPDNIPQTPAMIRNLIDSAVAKGFNGIFFDEGGVYAPWHNPDPTGGQELFGDKNLAAPGISSATFYNGRTLRSLSLGYSDYDNQAAELWKGLTFETGYTNYAKSKGLFVCLNLGIDGLTSNLNTNVFDSSSVDAILSSEDYNTRGNLSPQGIETAHPEKCWVLSYNGSFDVSATRSALNNGFGAAYCCESMGTLSSNFETYMAAIPDESPPATHQLSISVEGQGSTDPVAGDYTIEAGETVSIRAIPAVGWHFTQWSNGSTANPVSIIVNADNTITAIFEQDTPPQTDLVVPIYVGTSIPSALLSGSPKNRWTEGIWEVLLPRSSTDMTLVPNSSSLASSAPAFINACHNAGKLASFSIFAPYGENDYNAIFTNSALRQQLFQQIVQVFNDYDFDGVNMDWECDNGSNVVAANVTNFYAELYAILHPMGKYITATENYGKVVMTSAAANYLAWIGLMIYDVGESWATGYGTLVYFQNDLTRWANAGFPKNKLVGGMTCAPRDINGSWYGAGYQGIISTYNPAPSANSAGPYYYGGYDLAVQKAYYVKANGYGGVFPYYTQTDAFSDYRSLLTAIQTGFGM